MSLQQVFTSVGANNFTVPAGVNGILVECWGAGGGGSGAITIYEGANRGGAGGGGGGYCNKIFTVVPGRGYTCVVGGAGQGGNNYTGTEILTNGTNGGDSYVVDNLPGIKLFTAQGGQGGISNAGTTNTPSGGNGGNYTGTPTLGTTGGSGGTPNDGISCGGGGAAGLSNGGNAPVDDTGDGGLGTAGILANGGNGGGGGIPPSLPGGGGPGGNPGLLAADGEIIINYVFMFNDTLDLQERATAIVSRSISVTDSISLSDSPIRGSLRTPSDILILSEQLSGGKQFSVSVSDSIVISEQALKFQPQIISDNLTITELLSGSNLGKSLKDNINLQEIVSFSGSTRTQHLTDTINLNEFASAYIFDLCKDRFNPTPSLGIATVTVFSYPYISPTKTATLRNPKFINTQKQDNNTFVRNTLGGDQIIVSDPDWLVITTLELEFESLSQQQASDLLDLIDASAADDLKLVDWENRTWKGRIVSNPNPVIVTHDDGCSYIASLKFEGVLV